MKAEHKYVILAILGLFAAALGGYLAGWEKGRDSVVIEPKIVTDTLITRDTIYVDSPVPTTELPAGYEMVRVGTVKQLKDRLAALEHDADYWASNPDTVTMYVPVEITRKQYKGEDYEAQVSGYHPNLDWIKVFPQTVTVTTTQTFAKPTAYKWTLTPFAGVDIGVGTFGARAGVLYDRQLKGGLRLHLGGGYELRSFDASSAISRGFFATGGIGYQFHP